MWTVMLPLCENHLSHFVHPYGSPVWDLSVWSYCDTCHRYVVSLPYEWVLICEVRLQFCVHLFLHVACKFIWLLFHMNLHVFSQIAFVWEALLALYTCIIYISATVFAFSILSLFDSLNFLLCGIYVTSYLIREAHTTILQHYIQRKKN